MTVLEVIQRSTEFLAQKGVESPRLQIELMLGHVLRLPRLKLYLNFQRELTDPELDALRGMVKRRSLREPLQHIVGSTSFCGLEIKCSRAALVPRPETELLAERAWLFLKEISESSPTALEIGTGTGCIAIAMATQAPSSKITALDISAEALELARQNAAQHGLDTRIEFIPGDMRTFSPTAGAFELVVSNPPYIPSAEIETLDPEVREFDPRSALDGGADGLAFYRHIAATTKTWLTARGKLMLEFGDGQADALKTLFESEKWIVEEIVPDYSGRPRILITRPQ